MSKNFSFLKKNTNISFNNSNNTTNINNNSNNNNSNIISNNNNNNNINNSEAAKEWIETFAEIARIVEKFKKRKYKYECSVKMDQQMKSKLAIKLINVEHEIISKRRDYYDVLVDDFQIAQHICHEYGGIIYGSVSIQVTPNQLEDFTIIWNEESAQPVITNLSRYGKIINHYYKKSTLTIRMLQERGLIQSTRSGELAIDVRYIRKRRISTTSQEDESAGEENEKEETGQDSNQQNIETDNQQLETTEHLQPNNSDIQSTTTTNKEQIKPTDNTKSRSTDNSESTIKINNQHTSTLADQIKKSLKSDIKNKSLMAAKISKPQIITNSNNKSTSNTSSIYKVTNQQAEGSPTPSSSISTRRTALASSVTKANSTNNSTE